MDLQTWLQLIYWWAREFPVLSAQEEVGCSKSSAINVYQWLREVCSTSLCSQVIVLGGEDVVVQIDESMFSHKPKVYI